MTSDHASEKRSRKRNTPEPKRHMRWEGCGPLKERDRRCVVGGQGKEEREGTAARMWMGCTRHLGPPRAL